VRQAFLLAGLLAFASPAAAQALDRRLPGDTLLYVSLDDVGRTLERWRAGRWYRHWSDPSFQRLVRTAESWLAESRRRHEAEGKAWPALERARGQVVLAVVRAGGRPHGVVLVETGEDAGDAPSSGRALVHHGRGVRAIAWDRRALDALRAPGPSLADAPDYRAVRERLGEGADLTVFAARDALVELAEWHGRAGEALALLGENVRALGVAATLEPHGASAHGFVYAPGRKRGVLRLFDLENRPLAPPAFLPPGVRSLLTVRMDLGRLRGAVRDLAPSLDLDRVLPAADRAFLRALGDEFTTCTLGERRPPVMVLELDGRRRTRSALAALSGVAARRVQDEGGTPLYVGYDGSGLALRGDHLVAGERSEDVRALVRADPSRGVAGTRAYREALAGLPERRIALWYERPPAPEPGRAGFFRAHAAAVANDDDGLVFAYRLAIR